MRHRVSEIPPAACATTTGQSNPCCLPPDTSSPQEQPIQRRLIVERRDVPRLSMLPEADGVSGIGRLDPIALGQDARLSAVYLHKCCEHLLSLMNGNPLVLLA